MKASLSIVSALALFSYSCYAYEDESASMFNMSLKELHNMPVSIASSKSEPVIETPAIVSRYSKDDLELMGITNLKEMFNFVPGAIVQDSLTGISSVQIRGIDETFNQKVLFLLDGVPYHQPSHSLIPMEGVPWESISHIEVIRGPGAVFHGTQASAGVFNVVTKKQADSNTLSLRLGRDELSEKNLFISKQISDDTGFSIAAEHRADDGKTSSYIQKFPGDVIVEDTLKRYLHKKSAIINFYNNNLTAQLQAFSDTTIGFNDAYTDENTLQPFIMESSGYLVHLDNQWHIENWQLKAFADYNHYTFDLSLNNAFSPGEHAFGTKDNNGNADYRHRLGGSLAYDYNASLRFETGLETETRSIGTYRLYAKSDKTTPLVTLIPSNKVDESSAYAQFEYTSHNWRAHIGTRFTDNELNGSKFTPRLAFVYKFNPHHSLKALYSTGFNSPNPTQTSIFLPGNIIGNESLNAEIVKATDLAYSYTKDKILFVANIYHLKAEDFIVRKYSEALDSVTFFNETSYQRRGAELDFQIVNENSKLFANMAYQKDGDKNTTSDPDAFRIPKLTLSLGASKSLDSMHSIGANLSYISSRQNLSGYSVINANYTMKINDFELFVVGRNIFDEDIENPNNSSQSSELIAYGEVGSNIQVGVKFNF